MNKNTCPRVFMNTIFFIFILVLFFSFSCKKNGNTLIPIHSKDTLWLKEKTVVLVSPSLKKIEKLKKEQGEDFYTIADDANYYYANATEHMDSLHEKYTSQNETVILAYKDGTKTKVIPTQKSDWYSILYKKRNFKVVDLINFTEEYSLFLNHSSK